MNAFGLLTEFLLQLKLEIGTANGNWSEVEAYAAKRMTHLSTFVGQPGYNAALVAERNAIALKAGIAAVETADAAGQRRLGMIQGALVVLVKMLASPERT